MRPRSPEMYAGREFRVTSDADDGLGSLREAIVAADRSDVRFRIVIDVEKIKLTTRLPALVNPKGIVVDSGEGGCEIDAALLPECPVIDVAAPESVVRGVRINGAKGEAFLLRDQRIKLTRVA